MRIVNHSLVTLGLVLCLAVPATAEVSVAIGAPHISIRLSLPVFPSLVLLPGLPVYYAPQVDANYFFFDGLYWVFLDGEWYASDWYDGPWWLVEPDFVPLFILRIPVRYYRLPPPFFRGWSRHAPPHWGQHWGRDWEHRHRGWERWRRGDAPRPAPLPEYQRQYFGERYPRGNERLTLRSRHYRYQSNDRTVRERLQPRIDRPETTPILRGKDGVPRIVTPQVPAQAAPPRQDTHGDMRNSKPGERGRSDYERRPPRGERDALPRLQGKGRQPQERRWNRGEREQSEQRGWDRSREQEQEERRRGDRRRGWD